MPEYLKRIKLLTSEEGINWIFPAYGRVYWNAQAVKQALTKIPDFKEEDFDRDLGIQKDYGVRGPHRTPVNATTVLGAIPVLIALNREFQDCMTMVDNFRHKFEVQDRRLKEVADHLFKLSGEEFKNWLLEVLMFQLQTERNYFRTIYNNSNYQTEFKNFLKRLPTYESGDEVYLMGELHGILHLDVQSGLLHLKKIANLYGLDSQNYYSAREQFLKHHYHHGPAELDITVPRWGEHKAWVDDLVRNVIEGHTAREGQMVHTTMKIMAAINPFQRRKFEKMLKMSRDFLRVREEMRSYSTRAYYLMRLGLLEFAHRYGLEGNKVFMLEMDEVRAYLTNPQKGLPDISRRELLYEGYRNFSPPNEFGGTIQALKGSTSADGLKGLGCSPGEFTGRARVILDIHATGGLTKNDILITKFTDPGWTPVLARVGGVVTEVGGLLSHAAVIGREYGIPAILNLINATELVGDGDLIKINGKTGTVEIVEKATNARS